LFTLIVQSIDKTDRWLKLSEICINARAYRRFISACKTLCITDAPSRPSLEDKSIPCEDW